MWLVPPQNQTTHFKAFCNITLFHLRDQPTKINVSLGPTLFLLPLVIYSVHLCFLMLEGIVFCFWKERRLCTDYVLISISIFIGLFFDLKISHISKKLKWTISNDKTLYARWLKMTLTKISRISYKWIISNVKTLYALWFKRCLF